MDINISVAGKIATVADSASIVCGNSDYRLVFTFDAEWQNEIVKTCRFITAPGVYTDVVFEGTVCNIPVISAGEALVVGVFAGNLRTSTHAGIRLIDSITGEDGAPQPINPDAYYQAIVLVNQAVADAQLAVVEAEKAVSDADQALQAATILLESFNDDLGVGHQLQAALQESINSGALILSGLQEKVPQAEAAHEALADPVTGSIPLAEAAHKALADPTTGSIPAAEAAHEALADPATGSIKSAEDAKSALDGSVVTAGNSKSALDGSISTAQGLQTALADPTTGSIKQATDAHDLLADPVTGSIKQATDAKGSLDGSIVSAGLAEASLEQAIADGSLETIRENVAEAENDIKNIENVLLQLNPSGDPKVTVTSYDTVNSLPKNAAQAGLGIVQSGMTATNLVTNGDFSNGTTGWTPISSSNLVANKILSNTGSGTATQPYIYQSLNWKAANVYYISALARVTNANCLALSLSQDATEIVSQATPTQNSWYKLSGLLTASADASAHFRVRHRYVDNATALNKVMEVDGNYGVKVVNLTAIAQQALTLTQADAMLIDYFSGTQSAATGRVRSVGKNLFDGVWLDLTIGMTGETVSSTTRKTSGFIRVKAGLSYVYNPSLSAKMVFYDRSYRLVFYSGLVSTKAFTAPSGAYYVRLEYQNSDTNLLTAQLELGSTATTYEPYKRTEQYCKPIPLRRLPNTIIDDVTNGKHTKRIGDPTSVSGTMFASIDNSTYTNVSVVKTTAFSLATAGTAAIDNSVYYRDKNGVVLQEVAQADIDLVASIGKFYYHTDKTVWRILAKGSLDIATARTNLGTETITYQLATPVITENVTSGSILAYPSGTIYSEPVIADVAVYSTNAGILNTGYPISTLESIYKIDSITGEQTPLEIASATVASGGLSFTHTGLVSGDLVFFTYYYSHPYPYGLNSYTYIDSRGVVLGADGKYYKIGYAIDIAGNISLTKTEVA